MGLVAGLHHLINIRRTEILAGIAEFHHATAVADVGVVNDQVRGLVFFMARAGMIQVSELVERQFAVATGRPQQVRQIASVGQAIDRDASCGCARDAWYRLRALHVRQ